MAYKNKEDQKNFAKKWYLKNKVRLVDKAKRLNKIYTERNKNYVNEIKLRKGCIDCGYNKNPVGLDFDHLRDKKFNIARLVRQPVSIKLINKELEKCEVVCAICHRIRTQLRSVAKR